MSSSTASSAGSSAGSSAAAASSEVSPITFADVELENARDPTDKKRFGAMWADKPLVAVFLRRWGCQICRVHAQDIDTIRSEVEKLGARIVCFGHERFGEASDTDRSFEAGKYYQGEIYVDTAKTLYSALFSRKTLWQGYGLFDMSKERLAQVKERHVTGNYKGDGFQLGGTFVIDTDGSVKLDHRQKYYGDDASNEDILEAVQKCAGLRAPAETAPAAAVPAPETSGSA